MTAVRAASDPAIGLTCAAFGVSAGYATLRYNVAKGVPWADWPSYTLNKALGVTSLLLFVIATIRLTRSGRSTAGLLFAAGSFAVAHSLLSLTLLDPVYYAKFFVERKLTAVAGASLAIGGACTAIAEAGARRASHWSEATRRAWLAWLAFATGVHAALPGITGWLAPGTWPAGLPPITLLSALAGLVALAAWHFGRAARPPLVVSTIAEP